MLGASDYNTLRDQGFSHNDIIRKYEYGTWKWPKAANNNNKEVAQFLYNEKAVEWFKDYFSRQK